MQQTEQPETQAAQIVDTLNQGYNNLKQRNTTAVALISAAILLGGFVILILLERSLFLSGGIKITLLSLLLIGSFITGYLIFIKSSIPNFRDFFEEFFTSNNLKEALSATDLYLDDTQKRSKFYSVALQANLKAVDTKNLQGQVNQFVSESKISHRYRASSCISCCNSRYARRVSSDTLSFCSISRRISSNLSFSC